MERASSDGGELWRHERPASGVRDLPALHWEMVEPRGVEPLTSTLPV